MKLFDHRRAAIELSVNFLVILVISLAIFGFGITYLYKIFKGSEELKALTIEDIDRQIAALSCDNTQKICVDRSTIELSPNTIHIASIKILNIDPGDRFRIRIEKGMYVAPDNTAINPSDSAYQNQITAVPAEREVTIAMNEAQTLGIAFEYKAAKKGTYVFNANVYKILGATEQQYDRTQKIYITVK